MWWQRFLILLSTAVHYPLLKFILETFHTLWNMDLHLPHPYPIALHTYSTLSFLLALPLPPHSVHLLLFPSPPLSDSSLLLLLRLSFSLSSHLLLRSSGTQILPFQTLPFHSELPVLHSSLLRQSWGSGWATLTTIDSRKNRYLGLLDGWR